MANRKGSKRSREEDQSDPLAFESTDDSEAHHESEDDDLQARKKQKSTKDMVRYTAVKKLQGAPKGSIGIPAIRALLAKSGSSSTKYVGAVRETNAGLRRAGKDTTKSNSRKTSQAKGRGSVVGLAFTFFIPFIY